MKVAGGEKAPSRCATKKLLRRICEDSRFGIKDFRRRERVNLRLVSLSGDITPNGDR